MPRGRLGRIAILVPLVLLFLVGLVFFPTPPPHVVLPAEAVFHFGPIPIYNTMLTAWLSILVLSLLFVGGTRRMRLIPRGLQNLVEALVEVMLDRVEGVAGKENGRRFFPVVATIFLFVITNAWTSLLPGFNVIGFGEMGEYKGALMGHAQAFIVKEPLFRLANTDINVPLALAIMSFIFVEYWGISSVGFTAYASKFVRVGQFARKGVISKFSAAVETIFVGPIELLSEFIRIISFTFRLFANMTAGEVLLITIAFIVPWFVAVIFYALELLIGFVQALVFGLLTLVFATMAVAHHGEEHH